MLVGRDRQHVGDQRVVAREVVGIAVADALGGLLGIDVIRHRGVGQRQHGLGHLVHLVSRGRPSPRAKAGFISITWRRLNTSSAKIALQRRDADLLDGDADVPQRIGGGLHGRRHLGIDRAEAGSDHPAHAQRLTGLAAEASIELRRCCVANPSCAVRPDQLREGERDVAHGAGHRPDMPEAARRARPDAGHRHAAMGRLHRGDAGLGGRAAHGDGEIGAETDRRHARRDGGRLHRRSNRPACGSRPKGCSIGRRAGCRSRSSRRTPEGWSWPAGCRLPSSCARRWSRRCRERGP